MLTGAWMLFPGTYRVTLTGSGFDHSYIYARHGLINQETYKLDVAFTDIDAGADDLHLHHRRPAVLLAHRGAHAGRHARSPSPASRWKRPR